MKTLFLTLVGAALVLMATTLTTTVHAQSTEDVSIRKTIDAIRPAFEKHDLPAFAGYFKNSPDLYYQITTPDHQLIVAYGWENMKKMLGGYFQSTPVVDKPGAFKLIDSRIRVTGNMAVVTEGNDVNGDQSLHLIVLEKVAGAWKITAFMGESYAADKLIVVK